VLADRINQALCWLVIAGALTFIVLSRAEHVLKEPQQPPRVFAGTAAPLPVRWEGSTPKCANCGCEVHKGTGHCTHCGRDFLWKTADCPRCTAPGDPSCPCCGGDALLGN